MDWVVTPATGPGAREILELAVIKVHTHTTQQLTFW